MRRLVMVIILSMLLIVSNGKFGLAQSNNKVGFEVNERRPCLDISLQSGYLGGDTTYHISFPGGASELEFPLKTYLLGPEIGWIYKYAQGQDKLRVKVNWLTNIGHGLGKMKDSDWIDDDGQPGLDLYSDADIKLKANIFNVNGIYNFWLFENLSIGPMLGFNYQNLKYDTSNKKRVGYGKYASYTGFDPGKTLEYEVTYYFLYFGLNSDILFGKKFLANLNAGYTPWAFASDRDDHILRYKLSTGDTDGPAYRGSLYASWNFSTHLFLTIGGEYMKIDTKGKQRQSYYGGPLVHTWYDGVEVDDKITSQQWFLSATVTYKF